MPLSQHTSRFFVKHARLLALVICATALAVSVTDTAHAADAQDSVQRCTAIPGSALPCNDPRLPGPIQH